MKKYIVTVGFVLVMSSVVQAATSICDLTPSAIQEIANVVKCPTPPKKVMCTELGDTALVQLDNICASTVEELVQELAGKCTQCKFKLTNTMGFF